MGCDATATVSELMEMFDFDNDGCLSLQEFYDLVPYVQANIDSNYLASIPP